MSEIQALEERVRTLGQSADWWNNKMVWALVLTAIAAIFVVWTTAMALRRAGDKDDAQAELIRAKDRQLALDLGDKDLKIAEAQRGASEANARAESLGVEALKLRKQLLIQGARENILATNGNRAKLIAALKRFSGQKVDVRRSAVPLMVNNKIVSTTPIGDDTTGLADALVGVMKDAGWLLPPVALPWDIRENGISIEISDAASNPTRIAAEALVKALRDISLTVSGPTVVAFNSGRFARVGTVEQAMAPVLEANTIILGVLVHPE